MPPLICSLFVQEDLTIYDNFFDLKKMCILSVMRLKYLIPNRV